MKKVVVLLALIILVTGCSVTSVSDDLAKVIDDTVADELTLHNQYFEGYQYYLPREVAIVDKYDYNTVLTYKNNKMYLYVDIISYYHKVTEKYVENKDIYFSKIIDYDGKKGYINITKEKDEYYIEINYNYGKIEAYSNIDDVKDMVINALCILKTIKYNDVVIDSLIGENKIEYQEEKFGLFESDDADDDYLDIADDNQQQEDNGSEKLLDDDSIVLDETDEFGQ